MISLGEKSFDINDDISSTSYCAVDTLGEVIVFGNLYGAIAIFHVHINNYRTKFDLTRWIIPHSEDNSLMVPITSLKLSPCMRYLAAGTLNGLLLIFDLTDGQNVRLLEEFNEHSGNLITCLAWGLDSKRIYSACAGGILNMTILRREKMSRALRFASTIFGEDPRTIMLFHSSYSVNQLCCSTLALPENTLEIVCMASGNQNIMFHVNRLPGQSIGVVEIGNVTSDIGISIDQSNISASAQCIINNINNNDDDSEEIIALGVLVSKSIKFNNQPQSQILFCCPITGATRQIFSLNSTTVNCNNQLIQLYNVHEKSNLFRNIFIGMTDNDKIAMIDLQNSTIEVLPFFSNVITFAVCNGMLIVIQKSSTSTNNKTDNSEVITADSNEVLAIRFFSPNNLLPSAQLLSSNIDSKVIKLQKLWRSYKTSANRKNILTNNSLQICSPYTTSTSTSTPSSRPRGHSRRISWDYDRVITKSRLKFQKNLFHLEADLNAAMMRATAELERWTTRLMTEDQASGVDSDCHSYLSQINSDDLDLYSLPSNRNEECLSERQRILLEALCSTKDYSEDIRNGEGGGNLLKFDDIEELLSEIDTLLSSSACLLGSEMSISLQDSFLWDFSPSLSFLGYSGIDEPFPTSLSSSSISSSNTNTQLPIELGNRNGNVTDSSRASDNDKDIHKSKSVGFDHLPPVVIQDSSAVRPSSFVASTPSADRLVFSALPDERDNPCNTPAAAATTGVAGGGGGGGGKPSIEEADVGSTESEELDDDQVAAADDDDDDVDASCWLTVGGTTWREHWWDKSLHAINIAVRNRIVSCRHRFKPFPRFPVIPLLVASPSSNHTKKPSSLISGFTHQMSGAAFDLLEHYQVPVNTYEVKLQPVTGMRGLGLQLGVLGGGCLVVQGFTRYQYGDDVAGSLGGQRDRRGAAERCGAIAVGDLLLFVDGTDLSMLGLEQTLEVLRDLETEIEDVVTLRFMFGDSAVQFEQSYGAETGGDGGREDDPSHCSSSSRRVPTDRLRLNSIEDIFETGPKKEYLIGDDDSVIPSALLQLQQGFESLSLLSTSWRDSIGLHRRDEDRGRGPVSVTDIIMYALQNRHLYPCIYPTLCMHQRAQESSAASHRLLLQVAEESRLWLMPFLSHTLQSASSRKYCGEISFRKTATISGDYLRLRRSRGGVGSVSVCASSRSSRVNPSHFVDTVLRLAGEASCSLGSSYVDGCSSSDTKRKYLRSSAAIIRSTWGDSAGAGKPFSLSSPASLSHTPMQSDSEDEEEEECDDYSYDYESDGNYLGVVCVDAVGAPVPVGALASHQADVEANIIKLLSSLRCSELSDSSSQRNVFQMGLAAALGSATTVGLPSLPSLASPHVPSLDLTLRLRSDLIQHRSITILLDPVTDVLLSSWLKGFRPLPAAQRSVLRPSLITPTVAASLGFSSPMAMSNAILATEQLLTLYFAIHTVWPWLRYTTTTPGNIRGNVTTSSTPSPLSPSKSTYLILENRVKHGLSILGLTLSYFPLDASISVNRPNQWTDIEMTSFVRLYGAYLNLDCIAMLCSVRSVAPALTLLRDMARSDDEYALLNSHLFAMVSRITPATDVTARELVGHILQICGSDFPYSFISMLAILRTILDRNLDVGVELALHLFPFIRPWNIRELLSVGSGAADGSRLHSTGDVDRFASKPGGASAATNTTTTASTSSNAGYSLALGTQRNLVIYYRYLASLLTDHEAFLLSEGRAESRYPVDHRVSVSFSVCHRDARLVNEFIQLSLSFGYPTAAASGDSSLVSDSSVTELAQRSLSHLLLHPSGYAVDVKDTAALCLAHGHALGALELCRHQIVLLLSHQLPLNATLLLDEQEKQISSDEISTVIVSCLKFGIKKYMDIMNYLSPPTESTSDAMKASVFDSEFDNKNFPSNDNESSDSSRHLVAYSYLWMTVLSIRYLWVMVRTEKDVAMADKIDRESLEDVKAGEQTMSRGSSKIFKIFFEVITSLTVDGCKQGDLHKLFVYLLALAVGVPNASSVLLQMNDFFLNGETMEESTKSENDLMEVQFIEFE